MARIRTIKPEFWTDEAVVELDSWDRLFFIGLWNFADDHGFIDYRPKRIKMQVFPGDDFDVVAGLERLHAAQLISLYASETGLIVYINGWDKHQRVSNPARERYTRHDLHEYADFKEAVQSPLEPSRVIRKGREGKGKEEPAREKPHETEPDRFNDFWAAYPKRTAKGHALKAWKAAIKKTDPQTIIDAAASFSVHAGDPKFIPYPATWLNGERWADETVKQPNPANDAWGGVQWSK